MTRGEVEVCECEEETVTNQRKTQGKMETLASCLEFGSWSGVSVKSEAVFICA